MPIDWMNIPLVRLNGTSDHLHHYQNKVLLIVNVASQCGFTPQYAGLEALWQKYQTQGLVILGFPCNQFGKQEAGSPEEIQQFCQLHYGVTFPIFAKTAVNGAQTHPLYRQLKHRARGILWTQSIKWNFTKFLVSKNGAQVQRFSPRTPPQALQAAIETALKS